MQNKKLQQVLFLLLLFIFTHAISFAQLDDPGGGVGGGDPDVPIDGGLSLLVAAGIGYGAKQLKKSSKKNNGTNS